ncbi:hypothetical protein [Phyllobacterium chamaecytisi]|uniref:hypothetical protein n=1 Tax=Phyllobacterium chamaecytisi TaxID=2876082 RepID=UPI001CCE0B5D|nr:hypothetical protein [Phyllobacterium sp. KW56]MBZ9605025.1 hypothetical protein [Phyllobacterium sp. KW56]
MRREAFLLWEFLNGLKVFQIKRPVGVNSLHFGKYYHAKLRIKGDPDRMVSCVMHAPVPRKTIDGAEEILATYLVVAETGITESDISTLTGVEIGELLTPQEYESISSQLRGQEGNNGNTIG